jgi:hypothetical protein
LNPVSTHGRKSSGCGIEKLPGSIKKALTKFFKKTKLLKKSSADEQ